MEEKKISEKESLELITRMIQETKERHNKQAAVPMLIWGYLTICVTLLIWLLCVIAFSPKIYYLWLLLPLIGGPATYWVVRKQTYTGAKNYIDRIIGYIWTVFGYVALILSFLTFVQPIQILFIIALLMSMAATLTGLVSKFKPLVICASLGIVLSFIFPFIDGRMEQFPLFAVIFILNMIIPGHILHQEMKKA